MVIRNHVMAPQEEQPIVRIEKTPIVTISLLIPWLTNLGSINLAQVVLMLISKILRKVTLKMAIWVEKMAKIKIKI